MRGYAICTVGRSGSNWLCEILTSTGLLGCPLEYFNAETRRRLTDPAYPEHPAKQICEILRRGATPNDIYGLKVFPSHLDRVAPVVRWADMLPALQLVRWSRRDLLGQAISLHRAAETAQWRSSERAQREGRYDGEAIRRALALLCRDQARWDLFFARNGPPALSLVYEDVINEPQKIVDAFAAMMMLGDVPRIDPSKLTLKIQRDGHNQAWREQFLAEERDFNVMDGISGA